MTKLKYAQLLIIFLIFCFYSAASFADSTSAANADLPKLDNHPGFLKIEDPTTKGILYARVLRNGSHITLELYSPAYNFHGVETLPKARNDREKEQVTMATEEFVTSPEKYISFLPKDSCLMDSFAHKSEPVTDKRQVTGGAASWYINLVIAKYEFTCTQPHPKTMVIDLFTPFPIIKEAKVQLIEDDNKVRRINMAPGKTAFEFKATPSS